MKRCRNRMVWKNQEQSHLEQILLLAMVDILVMEGQNQVEFLHCTDPRLEQERINVTFRWIKPHVASCLVFRTGVACCLPTCAQGSSVSVALFVENGAAWGFCVLWGSYSHGGYHICWFTSSWVWDMGYVGLSIAGHAFRAEVGGGTVCVALQKFTGLPGCAPPGTSGPGTVIISV